MVTRLPPASSEPRVNSQAKEGILTIHTSLLFDSKSKSFEQNLSLEVDRKYGEITKVYTRSDDSEIAASSSVLDLRGYTVLPGLVDAHTHVFLHAYSETPSLYQERDESMVERIVRATNHCRAAIKAGYTTYRDLGTEGLYDADVGLRDSINRGIIPGPRMFVVTEALATSSGYAIRYESRLNGTTVPRTADECDGVDGVRAGVRRRVGAGADIIKFYAGYRRRTLRYPAQNWPGALPIQFPPGRNRFQDRNPDSTLFTQEEMNAIVDEARHIGIPVAAHAQEPSTVIMACKAGVTTVEHGFIPSAEARQAMKDHDVIFVPTLAILESEARTVGENVLKDAQDHLKAAWEMGVRLAAGGDLGGGNNHGDNARELELMCDAGVPVADVLRAATIGGWEACGGDLCGKRFGWLGEGWCADLIAVEGDPRQGIGAVRRVKVVVKDGRTVAKNSQIVE